MASRKPLANTGRTRQRKPGRPVNGQLELRENILRSAIDVFARDGYAGARVERISRAAHTTDRMIYYYFESKENLFIAALETIYQELGTAEAALNLSELKPAEGLRAIIQFTWNHYRNHPEMLSLLNNENLHQGRHLRLSKRVKELSFPLLSILSEVLARGVKEKAFRADVNATDLYIAMCALGYFYLSNRYTLSAFLSTDLMGAKALADWEQVMEDVVLRFVVAQGPRMPSKRRVGS